MDRSLEIRSARNRSMSSTARESHLLTAQRFRSELQNKTIDVANDNRRRAESMREDAQRRKAKFQKI